MLRSSHQIKNRLNVCQQKILSRPRNVRNLSTSSQGGGRSIVIAGSALLLGGATTVGAAWQIPSFRKSIQNTVPPAKFLFNPILGPLPEENDVVSLTKKSPHKPKPSRDVFESPLGEARKKKEKIESKEVEKDASPSSLDLPEIKTAPVEETLSESVSLEDKESDLLLQTVPQPVLDEPASLIEQENVRDIETESVAILPSENETQTTSEIILETSEKKSVKRSPEEVENSLLQLEKDEIIDTVAISTILDDSLSSCAQQCVEAIESNTEAAKAISLHTSLLRNAMDDTEKPAGEKHDQWNDLSRVLEQKSRLRTESENFTQHAKQELSKLEAIISEINPLNNPEVNKKIIDAKENLNAMRKELENATREVNIKLSESHVISEYKDLIDTAKEQFRRELLSVMPDVKIDSGWRKLSQKLTEDDLNALIAHAHRRVDQLQRELAEERAISTSRMETAVRAARERWEDQTSTEMEKRMELLKHENEIENDKKLEEARQTFESEMRVQLKRQAAAHSEHLADMLGIQEKQIKIELEEEFKQKLNEQEQNFMDKMNDIKSKYEDEIHEITDKFQFNLNRALAKVAGIEMVVDGRAYVENESRKAQELWLACEALRIAVQYGDSGKPVPLQKELEAITKVVGIESHVVDMVNSFPEQASDRGVFTEEALRVAYKQVSKMCKRLSLITETRNSLFSYILSYLKSFLIISRAQLEPPKDLQVDELNTFHILSYATYCLERGDLEQAARFMNQLTGEPRRVAEGWLEEARLLLETKQTVQLLSSLASATSIAANLEM